MRMSVAGRQGISLMLSMLKSILDEEAAFCASWLGLRGAEVEVEREVWKGGKERAAEQGEGVKERVLSKALASLVRQVAACGFCVFWGVGHGVVEHGLGVRVLAGYLQCVHTLTP